MRFENVLVTGSSGLLGRHVVRELVAHCNVRGFDRTASADDIATTVADITDRASMRRACEGCDAVVHIAAMPNIWSGSGESIIHVNVTGTWNVLASAEEAGVRRVVICSSDSVLGFTVMSGTLLPPLYAPVDLEHPLRPTDAYALSKLLGERIAESFVQRAHMEVVALRPVFVLYPEMLGEVRARAKDPARYQGPMAGGPSAAGGGPLWHYIDPRDAARAFRLALEVPSFPAFAAFYICASSTLAPEPTLQRLERVLGHRLQLRKPEVYERNPFAPLYDPAPARDALGFEPVHDLRPLVA
jgi:nucleoside-diphosphate-sugar epimerase